MTKEEEEEEEEDPCSRESWKERKKNFDTFGLVV